jgi:hypothetical protein
VAGPEAAQEAVVGDDAAEGSAGSRGAGEVGRILQVEEDVLQQMIGEVGRHRSIACGLRRRTAGDIDRGRLLNCHSSYPICRYSYALDSPKQEDYWRNFAKIMYYSIFHWD